LEQWKGQIHKKWKYAKFGPNSLVLPGQIHNSTVLRNANLTKLCDLCDRTSENCLGYKGARTARPSTFHHPQKTSMPPHGFSTSEKAQCVIWHFEGISNTAIKRKF
jgi:hypothetical protein